MGSRNLTSLPNVVSKIYTKGAAVKIVALACLLLACNSYSRETVAVIEFSNPSGQLTGLSSYLTDDLLIQLAQDTGIDFVERGELQRILQEQGIQASGAFDDKTIAKIGSLSGASQVILGKYYPVGDGYDLIYRYVDVKNGKVSRPTKKTYTKTESFVKLDAIVTVADPTKSKPNQQIKSTEEVVDTTFVLGPMTIDVCKKSSVLGGRDQYFDCYGTAYSDIDGRIDLDRNDTYMYFNNGSRGRLISGLYVSHKENESLVAGVKHVVGFSFVANDKQGLSGVQKSKFVMIYNGTKFVSDKPLPIKF